jgi:modulator of FtsH protease
MSNPQTVTDRRPLEASVGHTVDVSGAGSRVLRDTYRLLSVTLAFSAVVAVGTSMLGLPHPGLLLTLAGYFGLLFMTAKLRNSAWGLAAVFALTGFMGYTLGPLLNVYLAIPGGTSIVATAMGATAVVFLGLSAVARSTRINNLPKLGSFLFVGILTAFVLGLAAIFFQMPMLSLAVSGLFVLLMSGLIVYETQNIIAGGETNYIMATVTLFVAIYNLFTSLLHLLGFFAGDDG